MTDIIIYTTLPTLEHKKGGDGCREYYWKLYKPPIKFKEGEKVYFACNGYILGYFICDSYRPYSDEMICWSANSWVELKYKVATHSFRGFKYADKVPDLTGVAV